jgi:uncharacterized protein YacL
MTERGVRWSLAALGTIIGFYIAVSWLGILSRTYPLPLTAAQATGVAIAGAVLGALAGHRGGPVAVRGCVWLVRAVELRLMRAPAVDILAGAAGAVLALVLAFLAGPALAHLPWWVHGVLTVALVYLGVAVFVRKREDWVRLWRGPAPDAGVRGAGEVADAPSSRPKVLDTSAIIDGRVSDLYATGFLEGPLIVSHSVLDELRHLADSGDELRRQRGRHGLDVLAELQKNNAPVVFDPRDPGPGLEVDVKLVRLAHELSGHVVTTDYNLNKVAQLQGVPVLNLNELASALRPRFLPGEAMTVRVVASGKLPGQGLAYLEDGTMVLVENGRRFQGEEVEIVVTNTLQNAQGRMIFGRPRGLASAR